MPTVLTMIALTVASVYVAGRMAEARGRNVKAWLWIAAVIGPFALPVLFVLSPAHRDAH